jgi:spore maturation protein CgeB
LIPEYDFVFTYGGGPRVVAHYKKLGARNCHPIYNAHDADSHFPVAAEEKFRCDLAFVGNRLPDREARVQQFFLSAAEMAPELSFLLGGEGWGSKKLPGNVRWIGHVQTHEHNAVNCSARMVLNINRDSMADVGFSPPTRVFEAAGGAACLITDAWRGIESFFTPGLEILTATSANDVVRLLRQTTAEEAAAIGQRMRDRALKQHTYKLRASEVDKILSARRAERIAA